VKRHAFDPVSFVFGLLFAFLAVFVLTGNTLGDFWPTWAVTLPAMAVGLLVVLYAVRRLVPTRTNEDPMYAPLDDGDRTDT
jgi:hypothetical protein